MKKEEKELIIARLQTMPDNLQLVVGSKGVYGRKGLIKEVENETEVGELIIKLHMEYLKAVANGTLLNLVK
ncbi:unnamed protein product [marine sediment metagenome]|uniref:Uncharacterized protein n=1 Tax=marine sediment metagenome TaxID=412755 RepID=X1H8B5_9ZZZZ